MMRTAIRLSLCLGLCLSMITAVTPAVAEVRITPDVVYGHKDGMALFYDVFQPEGESNGAGILFMVSGGWFSVWTEPANRVGAFQSMLDAGYTVFAVHHGSAPRFKVPEAYQDVSRAVRHIRQNASRYGVEPDRLGVTGGSAGGHLSLMLGLNADAGMADAQDSVMLHSNRVAAVVAYFPPVDLRRMTGPNERFPALEFPNEQAADISPLLLVDPQDPPTLLIHGDADDLVDISHSINMAAELSRHGVTSDFITIAGGGHGFRGSDAEQANAARLAWFNQHLLPR
jgi:acetyl esterase/lipase